jgi:alpha-glucosidase
LGFGAAAPWLPQPAGWKALCVDVQTGDPESILELYRTALTLRRSVAGLADATVRWRDDLGEDVLAFERPGGFCCVVNFGPSPVTLPAHQQVLLSSGPLANGHLGPDTTAWLTLP